MAFWTPMVFTSNYKRKPKPSEMKLCWKKKKKKRMGLAPEAAAGEGCSHLGKLIGGRWAGPPSVFPFSWLVSVETFLFSLLLHISLILEKILLICLVSQAPRKGKCFNVLALLEEAGKGYSGKCQIQILLKIKLFQITKELVFEYQGAWRTQLSYFVLSVMIFFNFFFFPWRFYIQ